MSAKDFNSSLMLIYREFDTLFANYWATLRF